MTSLECIKTTINFGRPERLPVFSHVYGIAARLNQVPLKEYLNSGELLASCQLKTQAKLGYDGVNAFLDNCLEAEALGSEIVYGNDSYPHIYEHRLKKIQDWRSLVPPEPHRDGRMPVLLEACRILREQVGDETAVVGTVQGPMTLAGQLLGIEKLIYSIVDYPDEFRALMDFNTQVMISLGKALMRAGAHVIQIFDPSSSCSVINREVFSEFILPCLKSAIQEFKKTDACISWLNITGQTSPILDLLPESGADLYGLDYLVSMRLAFEKMPQHCVTGNIKPFSFVSEEEDAIYNDAIQLLEQAKTRGGFILGPGCEIPLEAKESNILAMIRAARTWRQM